MRTIIKFYPFVKNWSVILLFEIFCLHLRLDYKLFPRLLTHNVSRNLWKVEHCTISPKPRKMWHEAGVGGKKMYIRSWIQSWMQ